MTTINEWETTLVTFRPSTSTSLSYPGSWLTDKEGDLSPVPVPAHLLPLTSSTTAFKPCQDRPTLPDYFTFCRFVVKPVTISAVLTQACILGL